MDQTDKIKLADIPALHKDNIREYTASEIFKDLYDLEQIKAIMQERFTDAYLVSINPEQESTNPYIQDLRMRYQRYIENKPLNILILKKNSIISPEIAKRIEEMKAMYGDMIEQDKREYAIIIGFHGGSTGRTNQFLIDELLAHYPITMIH